ncbi:MAG: hypothetical protein U0271_48625 [Polyangiaceae bacterium]
MVDEAGVALLDSEALSFALLRDAAEARLECKPVAPELRAFVL